MFFNEVKENCLELLSRHRFTKPKIENYTKRYLKGTLWAVFNILIWISTAVAHFFDFYQNRANSSLHLLISPYKIWLVYFIHLFILNVWLSENFTHVCIHRGQFPKIAFLDSRNLKTYKSEESVASEILNKCNISIAWRYQEMKVKNVWVLKIAHFYKIGLRRWTNQLETRLNCNYLFSYLNNFR